MNHADVINKVSKIRKTEQLLMQEFRNGGILGTLHTSIGQEYVPVILADLTQNYMWFSNHRCHAHYLAKTGDFKGLMSEIFAKQSGLNMGVGGSQHLYLKDEFMSNGIQGGQMGLAMGYSSSLSKSKRGAVIFIGDGTLGAGHIYEAMNLGSIFNSRILIVLEDNEIAQSTPSSLTFRGDLRKRFEGFGINYFSWSQVDDWRESLDSLKKTANQAIQSLDQGPSVMHVKVGRLGPHSKGDDNRPSGLIAKLHAKDIYNNAINESELNFEHESNAELQEILVDLKDELPSSIQSYRFSNMNILSNLRNNFEKSEIPKSINNLRTLKETINSALKNAISEYNAILLGEDILDFSFDSGEKYGGAFKVSEGISTEYPQNIFNMPISESGFLGFATGVALSDRLSIVEIMFSDFLSQCADQIIHQVSKIPSMYGERIGLPLIIRTASGPGRGYGPTHSHTLENVVARIPNLLVASINPFSDYFQLIKVANDYKFPVLIYEAKTLYNYQINKEIYSEYQIQTGKNIFQPTQVSPKYDNAIATIVVIGNSVGSVLALLENLYIENEILINVFLPTVINEIDDEDLLVSIKSTKNLLIISDSLGDNPFIDIWLRNRLKLNSGINLSEISIDSWLPSGTLETEILSSQEMIINEIIKMTGVKA